MMAKEHDQSSSLYDIHGIKSRLDHAGRWVAAAAVPLVVATVSSGGAAIWGAINNDRLSGLRGIGAALSLGLAIGGSVWGLLIATRMADVTIVDPLARAGHEVVKDAEEPAPSWSINPFSPEAMQPMLRDYAAAWSTYLSEARAVAHDHAANPDTSRLRKAHAWLTTLHVVVMTTAAREAATQMNSDWQRLRVKLVVCTSISLAAVVALFMVLGLRTG
jgi:hypothetical protein